MFRTLIVITAEAAGRDRALAAGRGGGGWKRRSAPAHRDSAALLAARAGSTGRRAPGCCGTAAWARGGPPPQGAAYRCAARSALQEVSTLPGLIRARGVGGERQRAERRWKGAGGEEEAAAAAFNFLTRAARAAPGGVAAPGGEGGTRPSRPRRPGLRAAPAAGAVPAVGAPTWASAGRARSSAVRHHGQRGGDGSVARAVRRGRAGRGGGAVPAGPCWRPRAPGCGRRPGGNAEPEKVGAAQAAHGAEGNDCSAGARCPAVLVACMPQGNR